MQYRFASLSFNLRASLTEQRVVSSIPASLEADSHQKAIIRKLAEIN
jgi:hypothetical protein